MVTETHNYFFVISQKLQHVLYAWMWCNSMGYTQYFVTLPRLEVQLPPEPHMLKMYTLIALRFGLWFLNTQELRMNADVLSAHLGHSCFLQFSRWLFAWRLSVISENLTLKENKQIKRKLDSARLVQPIPDGAAITNCCSSQVFFLHFISGSACPFFLTAPMIWLHI